MENISVDLQNVGCGNRQKELYLVCTAKLNTRNLDYNFSDILFTDQHWMNTLNEANNENINFTNNNDKNIRNAATNLSINTLKKSDMDIVENSSFTSTQLEPPSRGCMTPWFGFIDKCFYVAKYPISPITRWDSLQHNSNSGKVLFNIAKQSIIKPNGATIEIF